MAGQHRTGCVDQVDIAGLGLLDVRYEHTAQLVVAALDLLLGLVGLPIQLKVQKFLALIESGHQVILLTHRFDSVAGGQSGGVVILDRVQFTHQLV